VIVLSLIIFLITGLIGGYLANLVLSRGTDTGLDWADFIFGVLGALVGGYLLNAFFPAGDTNGLIYSIIAAFVGALLLAALYRLIVRRGYW
jgi:uncharacterized membrane protein YeaQ/YmgE (transglycosylase-associated protein family)